MVKILNFAYNIIFFCSLVLAVLSLECKMIRLILLERFIFSIDIASVVCMLLMSIIAVIIALRLHHLLALLQLNLRE